MSTILGKTLLRHGSVRIGAKGALHAVDFFGLERVLFGFDASFDVQDGRISISETLRAVDVMGAAPETENCNTLKECEACSKDWLVLPRLSCTSDIGRYSAKSVLCSANPWRGVAYFKVL